MSDFPKQYNPKNTEESIQKLWIEKNIFTPKESRTKKNFHIPMPPPNVTWNLHLGHASMLAIEDIMVRYHRMKWDSTLWIPGTDHAWIATQSQVEKRLASRWETRQELWREKFLEECWKWIDEYSWNIQKQIWKMWASIDWSKERFTFDEKANKLVESVFVDLYNKWLIYRGEYMVNYSPKLESVISDIEVEYEEVTEKMYYINYFVSGSDKELLVATTRPETMLADQALAVHPKDKRYKKFIWKKVILPIINKEIPVIADEMVDMDFWTWVVKITPAHDPNDFETAKRNNLRTDYSVIDKKWYMTNDAGIFAWLHASTIARDNIVELLKSKWNLLKVEPYTHKVWVCSRSWCRIETVVSTQWFVKASELAKRVIKWYEKEEFKILPSRFNKTFEDWIYNLRDWCISRQLWWWHQIPAYFHKETWELLWVTTDSTEILQKYWEENVIRDNDVLDTWFSSWLWPLTILDWDLDPKKIGELFKKYYPAQVLETGHDILFFWVIRMLLLCYHYTDETPFKTIYLHWLIFDEKWKKMSKSFGNVIDPLEIIESHSTDALRLALTLGNTPWNNLNFSIRSVDDYTLFLNKFWNIVRFVWMNIGNIESNRVKLYEEINKNEEKLLPYEKWILSRLSAIIEKMTDSMENFSFSQAWLDLISFIRDDFADFTIEAYKIEKDNSKLWKEVLSVTILEILSMMHPYIPHITESLYWHITWWKILANDEWPKNYRKRDINIEDNIEKISMVVKSIRNIRSEKNIKPWELKDVWLKSKHSDEILNQNKNLLIGLAKINNLTFGEPENKDRLSFAIVSDIEIFVDTKIDQDAIMEERKRLLDQIEDKKSYLKSINNKLSNSSFTKNAPEKIVRAEMEKRNQAEEQLAKFEEKLEQLEKQL